MRNKIMKTLDILNFSNFLIMIKLFVSLQVQPLKTNCQNLALCRKYSWDYFGNLSTTFLLNINISIQFNLIFLPF